MLSAARAGNLVELQRLLDDGVGVDVVNAVLSFSFSFIISMHSL
jgi:hypothetical protein